MALSYNPTPDQLVDAVIKLENTPANKPKTIENMPIDEGCILIMTNTIILSDKIFENGDTFLMTFFVWGGGTYKDSQFSIIYAVDTHLQAKSSYKGEIGLYHFKGFDNQEHMLEIYLDTASNHIVASTTSPFLWLIRAGRLPSFGSLGTLNI